ncbi:MAG: hypothetical protein AVDCRST_MAG55-2290, partial [uncultured Rubrobacteraceae bacterium]
GHERRGQRLISNHRGADSRPAGGGGRLRRRLPQREAVDGRRRAHRAAGRGRLPAGGREPHRQDQAGGKGTGAQPHYRPVGLRLRRRGRRAGRDLPRRERRLPGLLRWRVPPQARLPRPGRPPRRRGALRPQQRRALALPPQAPDGSPEARM